MFWAGGVVSEFIFGIDLYAVNLFLVLGEVCVVAVGRRWGTGL
jgi:hypothetical protein